VEYFHKYPNYFNAMLYYESRDIDFADKDSVAAECLVEGKTTMDFLINSIEIGIKDGTIRSDTDPLKTALCLWGQTTGILQIASLKEKNILTKHFSTSAQELIDYNFNLIYHALKA